MNKLIHIGKANGTWVLRTSDGVLGETKAALELSEGDMPGVIYFPRADLAMAFLEPSDTTSHCPHKGTARYFDLVGASERVKDVGWSYEAPTEEATAIKDHIAFYTSKVFVEQV